MIRSFVALLAIATTAAGCSSPGVGDGRPPVTVSFDESEPGRAPRGFTTALTGVGGPVAWTVRADSTASSGRGRVLVQESADPTSYRFPICVYDELAARDVAVEVRFKPISGELDQVGGIVLRYQPESYYVARAQSVNSNVVLFKTVRGNRIRLKEADAKVAANEWHTLRFEARGSHLKVTLDGRDVIELDDSTLTGPGKVGVWTKADSVTAFDQLRIESLDAPGATGGGSHTTEPPATARASPDLDAALARARVAKRPLVVVVTDSGATATAARLRALVADARIQGALAKLETIKLDLDVSRSRATALRLHVEDAPAVLGFSSRGLVVARDEKVESEKAILELVAETERRGAELDDELSRLEAPLVSNPDDPGARSAIASFYLAHEAWRAAIPHLDALANSGRLPAAERVRAFADLARSYFATDDPEKGRRAAKALLARLGPTSPEARAAAHLLLGVRDGELGRTATALHELEEAIKDAPDSNYAQEAREARARLRDSSN
jgi:tetratricopeptide (TPR) repeat protein